jgi:parallel beta-helix repeat protein
MSGIDLHFSNSNNIVNNTFKDNLYNGIFLTSSSSNNTITGNNISDNPYNGIELYGSSDHNIIYNNYIDNPLYNAYDYCINNWNITKTLGTNIIGGPYLGGNYWSDYTGVDTDADGLGNTLTPYNTSINNGGDFHPLVSYCPPVCRNVEDNFQFCSIQEAIDASSTDNGETIEIYAGIHIEQVEVYKELEIYGQGVGSTTILSPDTLTDYFTTSANNYPIIYVHDVDNVLIHDLTVDGAGKGNSNYRFVGVGIYQAGSTLYDMEVINVRDTPFSGAQHGVGIYGWSDGTFTPHDINLYDCDVYDFQKNAMVLGGDDLTVDIDGCTTTGAGPTTVTAQNGIQVGYDATGTITDNTVTGMSWTGGYWAASGILPIYNGYLEISGNTIHQNQVNIYLIEGDADIQDNDIYATRTGVGGTDFYYGIIGDPGNPPGIPEPEPFDDTGAPTTSKQIFIMNCIGNTIVSDGLDTSCIGVGIYAGIGGGPSEIEFTAENNDVENWEYGFELYEYPGNTLVSADINYNNIVGNTYGIYNWLNTTYDATCNWWGDVSGPSGNGSGTGDFVSDYIDFCPWLDDTYPYGYCIGGIEVMCDIGGPFYTDPSMGFAVELCGNCSYVRECGELLNDSFADFFWDFGDGTTSTEQCPGVHIYDPDCPTEGGIFTYHVTFTVSYDTGTEIIECVDSEIVKVYCYDVDPPIIQLQYPKGGETLSGNVNVEWFALDEQLQNDIPIYLYFSANDGDTWAYLDGPLYNYDNEGHGEYSWSSTGLSDGSYMLKAEAVKQYVVVADTSDPFTINNGIVSAMVSSVRITDNTIDSSFFVKDGDTVQITAGITGASEIVEVYADLSQLGGGVNTIADSFDGFTATWKLYDVVCHPRDGTITVTVKLDNDNSKSAEITADNTDPESVFLKPLDGFYLFNSRILRY